MKKILLMIAFLCLGFSFGWLGRGYCHFPGPPGFGGSNFCSRWLLPPRPPHPPGPPPIDRLLDEAKVSPEQREKIKGIDAQHRPKIEELRKEVDAKRKNFEEALESESSQNELMPIYQELLDAKEAAEQAQFSMMMDVRAQLTPEQRKAIRPRGRGPGGGPPRGP